LTDRVIDTSVLSPFARARRLEQLRDLTSDGKRMVTSSVMGEIRTGAADYPELNDVLDLPWIEPVRVDGLDELRAFAAYARQLGDDDKRNVGEASVLAYAEVHGCTAVIDDEVAVQVGRSRHVVVQRTLALVAQAIRGGLLSEGDAERLVDALMAGGGRYPCNGQELIVWLRGRKAL